MLYKPIQHGLYYSCPVLLNNYTKTVRCTHVQDTVSRTAVKYVHVALFGTLSQLHTKLLAYKVSLFALSLPCRPPAVGLLLQDNLLLLRTKVQNGQNSRECLLSPSGVMQREKLVNHVL